MRPSLENMGLWTVWGGAAILVASFLFPPVRDLGYILVFGGAGVLIWALVRAILSRGGESERGG